MNRSVSRGELSELGRLLMPEEKRVPPSVLQTSSFLESLGIWFQLSRNEVARSCVDAAKKRYRNGEIGIPLYDELKSLYCGYRDRDSQFVYIISHCRADRKINFRSVQHLLGAPSKPQLLSKGNLYRLGLEYGVVNPFDDEIEIDYILDGPFVGVPVWHVFDEDILIEVAASGTMMTNAGSLTWAVEFYPREFVTAMRKSLRTVIVGDIGVVVAGATQRISQT